MATAKLALCLVAMAAFSMRAYAGAKCQFVGACPVACRWSTGRPPGECVCRERGRRFLPPTQRRPLVLSHLQRATASQTPMLFQRVPPVLLRKCWQGCCVFGGIFLNASWGRPLQPVHANASALCLRTIHCLDRQCAASSAIKTKLCMMPQPTDHGWPC